MKMYNLDTLFLIHYSKLLIFHKVNLLDYLISYCGTSIPMGSNQTWR